jgi:Gamma-glutamyl cyclotransferase, AIG2-like
MTHVSSGHAGTPSVPHGRLPAGPPGALFAYGTLTFTDVLVALLGRVPAHAPASAPGWRVAALHGRLYPVLVPGRRGGRRSPHQRSDHGGVARHRRVLGRLLRARGPHLGRWASGVGLSHS